MARTFRLLRRRAVADHGTTVEDLAAGAAEADALRARIRELETELARSDHDLGRAVDALDQTHERVDGLVASWVGGPEIVGEHTSGNDPWANGFEHLAALVQQTEQLAEELFDVLAGNGIDGTPFDPDAPQHMAAYVAPSNPGARAAAERLDSRRAQQRAEEARSQVPVELPEAPFPANSDA